MYFKPSTNFCFFGEVNSTTTGGLSNADSLPTATLYRNGVADSGVVCTVANVATGQYKVTGTLGAYSSGDVCNVLMFATVNSVTGLTVLENFQIDGAYNSDLATTLASIITAVAAIPAGVWGVATRTLSAFAFTPTLNASQSFNNVGQNTSLPATLGTNEDAAIQSLYAMVSANKFTTSALSNAPTGSGGSGGATISQIQSLILGGDQTPIITSSGKLALTSTEHVNVQTDVQTGLTTQGYTTARAAFLDTLNGIVANVWSYVNRTITAFNFTPNVVNVTGTLPTVSLGTNEDATIQSLYGMISSNKFTTSALSNAPTSSGSGGATISQIQGAILGGDGTPINTSSGKVSLSSSDEAALTSVSTIASSVASLVTSITNLMNSVAGLPASTATAVMAKTIDGTLTLQQAQELELSIAGEHYIDTAPSVSSPIQTIQYYHVDGVTLLATDTINWGVLNGALTSPLNRSIAFNTL